MYVPLERAIKQRFDARQIVLVDAQQAAATLVGGKRGKSDAEAIVLDTVASFDGLERLIVFAVGLDAPIGEAEADSAVGTLQTRSYLYRALTRAHSD